MNERRISRTGERVLGIIGTVFNVLAILLAVIVIISLSGFEGSPEHMQMQEDIMNDPMFTDPGEAQMASDLFNALIGASGTIGWVLLVLLVISTVLAILAIVNLKDNRNPQNAGILFIIAGVFAGLLSVTSILFYIAAIMCFVRKPPMGEEDLLRQDGAVVRDDDTPYRPL